MSITNSSTQSLKACCPQRFNQSKAWMIIANVKEWETKDVLQTITIQAWENDKDIIGNLLFKVVRNHHMNTLYIELVPLAYRNVSYNNSSTDNISHDLIPDGESASSCLDSVFVVSSLQLNTKRTLRKQSKSLKNLSNQYFTGEFKPSFMGWRIFLGMDCLNESLELLLCSLKHIWSSNSI